MRYGTILADPPWRFKNFSMKEKAVRGEKWARRNGRSPYDTMDTEAIESLPVRALAAQDCTLLLWATNPKMEDAFRVLRAWGFEYKTMLTWVKMTAAAAPRIGLGYHARSATEHLLIGAIGSPGVPEPADRPCSVIFCPIGEHSKKPEIQYQLAEGYPGPYVELFHRPRDGGLFPSRPGWDYHGFEVDGSDMRETLERLAVAP